MRKIAFTLGSIFVALLAFYGTVALLSATAKAAGQCVRTEVCDVTTFGTLKIGAGVSQDSGGIKHTRGLLTAGCATAASVGATCSTAITFTTPFADASYTVNCQGIGVTSGVPAEGAVTGRTSTGISFTTIAETAAAAQFTTVECMAFHDGI